MDRPNIVYLHSHDTGRYVRPYGHAMPTPHLQRLADDGVLFRRAFSAAPTCSPSRAALLTGQNPHQAGILGLAHRGFSLRDYDQHLVQTLHGAGYTSALAGIQHVAAEPERVGYGRILRADPRDTPAVASAASGYLHATPEEPFFLDVGFYDTHREFPAATPRPTRYVRQPAPLPDTLATRQDMAAYLASVRRLDEGIGSVLAALDATGLADRTLVIGTTDHGLAFPGMKSSLTDHGIGVMLILRGPGDFSGGTVSDAMVSQIDLFPTLCDLLDIDQPPWLEGESLLPLLRGERDRVHDAIFTEVTFHAAYEPQRAIRTDRWKYIRRFGDRTLPVLANVDDGPSKDLWLENGWADRAIPLEQLYDLLFDPNEAHNLIDDPALAETASTLRADLDAWMTRTNDPLLDGPVPAPPGARLNDPDDRSPQMPTRTVPG